MTGAVVVGAGGFGREALDVLLADPRAPHLVGVVDDAPSAVDLERLAARGIPYLGTLPEWSTTAAAELTYVLAIGSPEVRRRLVASPPLVGRRATTIVHPTASLGSEVVLGDGSVVCAGVRISTNVMLGAHVHVGAGAIIGHDVAVDEVVSINPGAVVSGSVRIRTGALVGAAATVLQGLDVGPGAVVGAAACVTRDVVEAAVVKGVPAR